MLKRLFMIGAAAASAGAAIGYVKARSAFRSWGVRPEEASMPLPGDELVPEAEAVDTRSIEIGAPPAAVWPWLVQMGYGRAGWYSYDELDMDRPSAEAIVPELQHIKVGDIVPTHPGGGFEVRIVEPKKALVLYADRALIEAQAKEARERGDGLEGASANVRATGMYLDASMPGDFQASWAFVLQPLPEGRTRLIERFRGQMRPPESAQPGFPPLSPAFAGKALLFGLFVMVRRQMLGIRDRAEGRPVEHAPWHEAALRARQRAMAAAARHTPDVTPQPEVKLEPATVREPVAAPEMAATPA